MHATTKPAAQPKRRRPSPNVENDVSVHIMAQQRLDSALADMKTKLESIEKTLGGTDQDEHGALIGTGIAGNLARLEKRVNQRFAIYDGVTKYAAGATAAVTMMSIVVWFVVKAKLEAIFQ